MKHWITADIPDQAGKWAIVTGANSGIGFSAARELARKGCDVILACRNAGKGHMAKERIEREIPAAVVEVGQLDLASLQSVRGFAEQNLGRGKPLDILINNAAVMATPTRQTTVDGFEAQFGTNHLGHFALTGLLLPALRSAKAGRIVTVSSLAHREGRIHFDDLQLEKKYTPWTAYRQSKLANLMFALELERQLRAMTTNTISIAVHPGLSKTSIIKNGPGAKAGIGVMMLEAAFALLAQSADQGALPTLFAATAEEARGGKYYGPDGIFEWRGYPTEAKMSESSQDESTAEKLWAISQKLTGVSYDSGS